MTPLNAGDPSERKPGFHALKLTVSAAARRMIERSAALKASLPPRSSTWTSIRSRNRRAHVGRPSTRDSNALPLPEAVSPIPSRKNSGRILCHGVFPAARGSDLADQFDVGRVNRRSHVRKSLAFWHGNCCVVPNWRDASAITPAEPIPQALCCNRGFPRAPSRKASRRTSCRQATSVSAFRRGRFRYQHGGDLSCDRGPSFCEGPAIPLARPIRALVAAAKLPDQAQRNIARQQNEAAKAHLLGVTRAA
jgi:hypothetical protein